MSRSFTRNPSSTGARIVSTPALAAPRMQFDHVWIMVSPNAPERAALERAGFEIAKEVNRLPGGVPLCALLFGAVEGPAVDGGDGSSWYTAAAQRRCRT